MASKESKVAELFADLKAKRAEHQAKYDTASRKELHDIHLEVKALGDAISAAITDGSEPCETCKGKPLGLIQEVAIKAAAVPYFEVGCPVCPDHRAQGFTIDQAVEKWNAETYLAPKAKELAPDGGEKVVG